jgi:hypothetical protein
MKGTDYVVVSHTDSPEDMGVVIDHVMNLTPKQKPDGSPDGFSNEPVVAVAWFDKPNPCPSYHSPEELKFEGMHSDLSREDDEDDSDNDGDDPGGEPVALVEEEESEEVAASPTENSVPTEAQVVG